MWEMFISKIYEINGIFPQKNVTRSYFDITISWNWEWKCHYFTFFLESAHNVLRTQEPDVV